MKIEVLDKTVMKENLEQLLELERFYSGNCAEMWRPENFMFDLPMKWDLSQIASEDGKIKGYIVCSKKLSDIEGTEQEYYFVHRTFIHPDIRKSTLLARLFINSAYTAKRHGLNMGMWKCSKDNKRVYEFHLRFADRIIKEEIMDGATYSLFVKRL